jgi:hypothetical protein
MLKVILLQHCSFQEDGISTASAKMVAQKNFNAKDRELYGAVFLELYGEQAGLFRYSNRGLAEDLLYIAKIYFIVDFLHATNADSSISK